MKKIRIVFSSGKELTLGNIEEENVTPITDSLMKGDSCDISYLQESYLINFANVDYVYFSEQD